MAHGLARMQPDSERKRNILLAFCMLFFIYTIVSLPAPIHAANEANDNVSIGVNITGVARIQVLPTDLNWTGLEPGSNSSIINVTITNTGSYNLTNFFLTVNTRYLEHWNPLTEGNISKYAASGFVLFKNDSNATYYHMGRLEWNLTSYLDQEVLDMSPQGGRFGHGWYRLSNGNEYLWRARNGSIADQATAGTTYYDTWCNFTDTTLVISKFPETSSGYYRDLTSSNISIGTLDANNSNWSVFSFNASEAGPLSRTCVAVYKDCSRIYVYKYDKTATFAGCTDSDYFFRTSELAPGDKLSGLRTYADIPNGVPRGDARQSVMTVYASIAY